MKIESDVWLRHGGDCFYCGVRCLPHGHGPADGPRDATRDHVQAKALGGRHLGPANIVLACRRCNQLWASVEDQASRAGKLLRRLYRRRGIVASAPQPDPGAEHHPTATPPHIGRPRS